VLYLGTITLITFALWYTIRLCALCSYWTVFIVTALNWSMASIMIWVSYCTNWTQAFVGSSSIVTSSTWATWWVRTKINQLATYPWISSKSRLAVTNLEEWLLLYYVTILDYTFLLNFLSFKFLYFQFISKYVSKTKIFVTDNKYTQYSSTSAHLLVELLSIWSRGGTNVCPEIPLLRYSYGSDSKVREISCITEIFSWIIFNFFLKKMSTKVKV